MTTEHSTDSATRFDGYLPAVLDPASRPGAIEWLLTKPLRRERAARQQER